MESKNILFLFHEANVSYVLFFYFTLYIAVKRYFIVIVSKPSCSIAWLDITALHRMPQLMVNTVMQIPTQYLKETVGCQGIDWRFIQMSSLAQGVLGAFNRIDKITN